MSKMIRVESCEYCKYFASEHVRIGKFYCAHPKMNLSNIKEPFKILPNCQLQNYSQADTRIKEVRKNFIKLQERMICINAEIQEFEKSKEGKK